MLDGSTTNQEVFFLRNGPATIGALLQKVTPSHYHTLTSITPSHNHFYHILTSSFIKVHPRLLTVQFLSEIQHLTELFTDTNRKDSLHLIMQHLLFNFYIWSRPPFSVRIGQHSLTLTHSHSLTHPVTHSFTHSLTNSLTHPLPPSLPPSLSAGHIQYLSNIIHTNLSHCRAEFGIQYILDVIKEFYSQKTTTATMGGASDIATPLVDMELRSIRAALFDALKLYVKEDVGKEEVGAMVAFLASCPDPVVVGSSHCVCSHLSVSLSLSKRSSFS